MQNPRAKLKLKNRFGVTATNLPTPVLPLFESKIPESTQLIITNDYGSDCIVHRLKLVQKSLAETKNNIAILAVNSVLNLLCTLLPETFADALLGSDGCTMAISNLPGMLLSIFRLEKKTIKSCYGL